MRTLLPKNLVYTLLFLTAFIANSNAQVISPSLTSTPSGVSIAYSPSAGANNMGLSGGLTMTISNTGWGSNLAWGIDPTAGNGVHFDYNSTNAYLTTPAYSAADVIHGTLGIEGAATNLSQGKVVLEGSSNITYSQASSTLNATVSVPLRATIKFMDASGNPVAIKQNGSVFYYPITSGNSTFKVNILVEAYTGNINGDSYIWSGTPQGNGGAFNQASHAGWFPALQLFNDLSTPQSTSNGTTVVEGIGDVTGAHTNYYSISSFANQVFSAPSNYSESIAAGIETAGSNTSGVDVTVSNSNSDPRCYAFGYNVGDIRFSAQGPSGSAFTTEGSVLSVDPGSSNVGSGLVILRGSTTYEYVTSGGVYTTTTLPTRYTIQFKNSSNVAVPAVWQNGIIYAPVPNGPGGVLKVNIKVEADDSKLVSPLGYTKVNGYVGTLTLFNALHTNPGDATWGTAYTSVTGQFFETGSESTAPTGITGTTSICAGTSTVLTVQGGSLGSGASYKWYSGSCGGTLVGTGNSVTVTPASNTNYYVRAEGTCNYTSCASTLVTVNANPTVSPTATGSSICNGGSSTLAANATAGSGTISTYAWSSALGNVSGGSVSPTSNTTYGVTVTNSNGCTVSGSTTVNVSSTPVVNITGATSVCVGGTVTLTANVTGGIGAVTGYQWQRDAGNVATANPYATSSALSSGSYSYRVSVTQAASGCSSSFSTAVNADVVNDPVVSISGAGNVCQGSSLSLNANVTGGVGSVTSYQWQQNASNISTSNPYNTSTGLSPGSYSYQVSVTQSGSGCASSYSPSVSVTVHQGVTGLTAVAGANPICEGADLNLSASVTTGTGITYNWSGPGSYSVTNNQTPTRTTILESTGEGTYTVSAVNACGTFTATVAVNVHRHIIGLTADVSPNPVCQGNDVSLTASYSGTPLPSGDVTWTWDGSNSAFSGSGQNTTRTNIQPSDDGIYNVHGVNACGSADASTAYLQVTPAPTANAGSNATVCSYVGSYTLNGSVSNAASYSWSTSGSGSFTNGSTLTPTYVFGPGETGNVTVTLHANGNSPCSPATSQVVINIASPVAVSASNTGPYAAGQTVSINSSPAGLAGYAWSGPSYTASGQNQTIANATSANSGVYTVVSTDANGCTASANTTVSVYDGVVWTGAVSQDWNVAGNWNPNIVPNTCGVNVLIPTATANSPVVFAPVTVKNLDVNNNVSLTLLDNLIVCGNATLGGVGTDISGVGHLRFAGVGNQTLGGTGYVENLSVDNTNAVGSNTIHVLSGSKIYINQELLLNNGTLQNSGTVTLVSHSGARTAYLNDFCATCTGTYSGSITAQRMVDNGPGNDQHFLGVPVTGAHVSDFADDVVTSGTPGYIIGATPCSPNYSAYNSPYGHVFRWDEFAPHPNGCSTEGWDVITNPVALAPGQGVSMYIPTGSTLDVTGGPVTGNLDITNLTNSSQGYGTDGWVLLSNPYPSETELTTSRIADGFDNQVQIWHTSGRFYGTYQQSSIAAGVYLTQYQGFFVHVSDPGTKTWHFYQNERTTTQATTYVLQANDHTLNVYVDGNGRSDKTQVGFNTNAAIAFDKEYDADKFRSMPGVQTLYTGLQTERIMGINTQPSLTVTSTVPMGFAPGTSGQFTISADGITTFDPTTYIYLEDKFNNSMTDLRSNHYVFQSNVGDDENRFILHFTPPAQITTTNSSCVVAGTISLIQPGPATWNYMITDANSAVVATGVVNQNQPMLVNVPAGIYTLTLADNNGYTVVKTIQVNGTNNLSASFTASSTTVPALQNITFSNTTANASSYEWDFSDGTIITGVANPTYAFNEPGTYTVTLIVHNSDGCVSTVTQTITVTDATGIQNLTEGTVGVYSYKNKVVVDFSQIKNVDATIQIFNLLGQEISNEKYTLAQGVYTRNISNLGAAYVLVKVQNGDQVTTRRVFVDGSK